MLLSELLVRDEVAFQKRAITMLPLAAHGAITAKEPLAGAAMGALTSIPTDMGIVGGGLLGAMAGGAMGGEAGGWAGPGLGAIAGGLGGYSLGDYALRKIIGEKRYKEIFDLERERKVKDKNVIT